VAIPSLLCPLYRSDSFLLYDDKVRLNVIANVIAIPSERSSNVPSLTQHLFPSWAIITATMTTMAENYTKLVLQFLPSRIIKPDPVLISP
jgi:hypothetical protein